MTSSWSPDSPDAWRGEDGYGAAALPRPAYRPPIGIPSRQERGLVSTLVSIGLHALVILLLLAPVVATRVFREAQGAGGEGPAGGGGGGTLGTGGRQGLGVVERLHYIQVAPPPPAATTPVLPVPQPKPPVTPPVTPPVPRPVPPPTPPAPPAQPTPAPAAEPTQVASTAAGVTSGTGGGTGADGTAGSGPGTGSGVGSGVGTGRGSGVGPGAGGGSATVYPPQATEIFLAPWPVPDRVKGTQIIAEFDVDSTGRVLAMDFTPTRDGAYNKKLRDVLRGVRFRPAVRGDGQPVRAKGTITYTF